MEELTRFRRAAIDRIANDPTDIEGVKRMAKFIWGKVGDKKMHASIAWKAANAVCRRGVDLQHIQEALDSISRNRDRLGSCGAYFVACLKRILSNHGIEWDSFNQPANQPTSQPAIQPSNHPSAADFGG